MIVYNHLNFKKMSEQRTLRTNFEDVLVILNRIEGLKNLEGVTGVMLTEIDDSVKNSLEALGFRVRPVTTGFQTNVFVDWFSEKPFVNLMKQPSLPCQQKEKNSSLSGFEDNNDFHCIENVEDMPSESGWYEVWYSASNHPSVKVFSIEDKSGFFESWQKEGVTHWRTFRPGPLY